MNKGGHTISRVGRRGLDEATIHDMQADYLRLRSLSKVGKLWGRTRQSMHAILAHRNITRPRTLTTDIITYNGAKYTPGKNGYFRRCVRKGFKEQQLHRIKWMDVHGEIPEGHQVMFKDGNKRNIAIDNLVCLPLEEVSRLTATGENQHTQARRERLAKSMERYIFGQAHKIAGMNWADPQELIQLGTLEAMRCADSFREDGGSKFFGYSHRAIRATMMRHARRFKEVVDVPIAKFGMIQSVSIHAPLSHDEDAATLEDILPLSGEDSSEISVKCENAILVSGMVEQLPERLRTVVRLRFYERRTLVEIAKEMGLSRGRIYQLERLALRKLRRLEGFKKIAA